MKFLLVLAVMIGAGVLAEQDPPKEKENRWFFNLLPSFSYPFLAFGPTIATTTATTTTTTTTTAAAGAPTAG
jgi:hypothetical protein